MTPQYKLHILKIYFILLFAGFSFVLKSQTFSFYDYTVQDGLAQSNVIDIIQDKQGYIWLGTESGLSRYDGKTIQNYSTEDGLADNNISAMLLDKDGKLWIGHNNGTISRYNGVKFEALDSKNLPQNRKIYSLYQDKSGKIWISAAAFGVVVILNPNGDLTKQENYQTFKAKDGLSEYVTSIYQTQDSTLWFITDIGIKHYLPKEKKFDFFKFPGLPALQKTCMIEDKKGNLWIGTYAPVNALLIKLNRKTNSFATYTTQSFVRMLKEDHNGNIWAATWGSGIYLLNEKGIDKHFSTENGLSVNKIYSVCEDRENNMIFGTFGGGFTIYKGERFVYYTTTNGLINDQVWSVNRDGKHNLWFGTNAGVSIYNLTDNTFKNIDRFEGVSNKDVRSIKRDKNNDMWIVCGGKLLKYNTGSSQFKLVPKIESSVTAIITAIEIDHSGNMWIGTNDGILIYNIASGTIERSIRTTDGIAGNEVVNIYEDKAKNIWICSKERGLTLYKNSKFKIFLKEDGFISNNPISVSEDKQGNIWVGTEGKGVFVYDGEKFSSAGFNEELVSERISLVMPDGKNNLWFGTNKGLKKVDIANKKLIQYGKLDGFKSLETLPNAVFKDDVGNIWFGTVGGVVKYNPDYDVYNNAEPLTSITEIKLSDNKKLNTQLDKTELSYKQNSLTFECIGICLSNPEKVKYQVMLEGMDEGWRSVTKQTTFEFSNLMPGEYVFKVKACNNNEVWNQTPVSFSFEITPPWYKTRWFYFIVVGTLVGIISTYINVRERNLIKEKKVLEDKVAERTAEVVKKSNELDEKNKEIMASIRYAKRIQDAILPPESYVKSCLPQTFVLYKPKDIVSGDFYWVSDKNEKVLFAAVDCTGHGVPGAFMSIVGHNLLEQIVNEHGITEPAAILDALNKSVSDTLRQSRVDESVKDGMDITLCCFDTKTNVLEFAGAYNPLYLIKNGELTEIKGDKFPIGNLKIGEQKKFTNHIIPLQKGDSIYIFSDGYADQFGGPAGKKFKYNSFKTVLMEMQSLDMQEQKDVLNKTIEEWKGDLEQVDDILVIGTRIV